ncbi:helix-turn-helix transcriptional regulator [Bradyrhizobium jicamae]|uniref:helix-turn-helix transcriptional regulator n=1 Tax=Bradyrhizobium jicamae TaxID=280332 RepID=UPI001BAC56D2|nr:helix-turn-helix transcriptional regulator [Bradyrhizobium jicamae]MBR0754311.1 helix-turn-helix transcriptional regulator [Bradyrhizobium jicamae]
MDDHSLTPSLLRAARGLIGWSQTELAQHAGVSRMVIAKIETTMSSERHDPRRKAVLKKLRKCLEEECDIEFIFASDRTGEGVRLRTKPR